jgi:spore cortex formation protein SpoVR/YcgB (stage V sporulation)
MKLNELEILEDDFDLFVALDDSDKIEFLFDATQIGMEAAVIKQVARLTEKYQMREPIVQVTDYEVGPYRISVTEYPDKLHINSNSLRAIRRFVEKLWNDGTLLRRVKEKKTEFDIYKYLRVYDVIGKVPPICSN